jgi:fatty-acyl-CoA synthase
MQKFRIASIADVQALEQRPYAETVAAESIHQVLTASAARFGDRPALTYLTSGDPAAAPVVYRYRDLLAGVTQTANFLRSLGVDDKRSVAFLLPSIPEAYFALLGGETAGRVCPINYLLNPEHIAQLLRLSNATVLIALGPDPRLDIWSKIDMIRARCPQLEHVVSVGANVPGFARLEGALSDFDSERLAFTPSSGPDTLAACFHTGGTTGAPKLAQHTHGNQIHAAWGAAQMYDMSENDVIINGFPLFHVAGSFVYGLSALMAGANIVLPTLLGMRDTQFVSHYWRFVERYRATLLAGVPTVIAALLNTSTEGSDWRSVRCMLTGGSPLPTELANNFEQRFGVPVRNILGMTECAGVISIIPFHAERIPGSCGLRLPYTELKIVRIGSDGPDMAQACAVNESGVVLVRGPNVGPGYTDASKNSGTFTEDGWLITGDLGHISERGELHLTGRAKDVIIRGGHNIDPAVIEEALLQHPAVQMAAAVGQPDEYAGELPVAFVTLKPGQQVNEETLLRFVQPLIPERPAVPKAVTVLDAMPVTAIGKIYKPALRLQAIESALRERVARQFAPSAAPRVAGSETGSKVLIRFIFPKATDIDKTRQDLVALMGKFTIDYEIDISD